MGKHPGTGPDAGWDVVPHVDAGERHVTVEDWDGDDEAFVQEVSDDEGDVFVLHEAKELYKWQKNLEFDAYLDTWKSLGCTMRDGSKQIRVDDDWFEIGGREEYEAEVSRLRKRVLDAKENQVEVNGEVVEVPSGYASQSRTVLWRDAVGDAFPDVEDRRPLESAGH